MLEWYKDDELAIFFDNYPKPKERFIVPGISDKTKESIKKFPYMNLRDLTVTVFDHINQKKYEFKIPKKYCFDTRNVQLLASEDVEQASTSEAKTESTPYTYKPMTDAEILASQKKLAFIPNAKPKK